MPNALNILVVDDDVDNAHSMGELFELEGHHVSVVHSGQEAIDSYVKNSFDIAFMDVMMPGKNGVESFLEIRNMRPKARVFMMTGYSVEELLQQAVKGGALGVLDKPLDANEILRLTNSVGPDGLVVSASDMAGVDVGGVIHSTLRNNGLASCLMRNADQSIMNVRPDEVLVIDANIPLIDEVSVFTRLKRSGHKAQTIIVPPAPPKAPKGPGRLWNMDITGILTKPFDPEYLLYRLPSLAS